MAQLDSAREELGWLKVLFTVLAAIGVSLIAWLSQAYDTAKNALLRRNGRRGSRDRLCDLDQSSCVP